MRHNRDIWLAGRAIGAIFAAMLSGLVAAQWHHEAMPFAAFAIILALVIVKARWIIFDFMGLRSLRPRMAVALVAWPVVFVLVAAARTAFTTFGVSG
ncbi:MAG TPA: hypothetical protein VL202_14430 [Pararhizobium sp.]|uniref:hypothetical protein n=1 Tax=Pararhizobium sp. TaxID=1977563 RepID=UPI002C46E4CC|nr:hypothetical protein [Pararhizobium sp.]HTO32351.1 hypothetical protein [Pararhizobium sp.]